MQETIEVEKFPLMASNMQYDLVSRNLATFFNKFLSIFKQLVLMINIFKLEIVIVKVSDIVA